MDFIVQYCIFLYTYQCLLQLVEAISAPAEPGPKATEEEGSVIIEGGELYSNQQQEQEETALNKSMEVIVYDTPSNAMLGEGVPSVVVTYTVFGTSPSISVLNDNVSYCILYWTLVLYNTDLLPE